MSWLLRPPRRTGLLLAVRCSLPACTRRRLASTSVACSEPQRTPAEVVEYAARTPDLRQRFYRNQELESWASKKATLTTLRHLILFGRQVLAHDRNSLARASPARAQKLLLSGNFVRHELPVRLSHRLRDLQSLPYAVMTHQQMSNVYREYYHCFEVLRKWPPLKTLEQNQEFCRVVRGMLHRNGELLLPALTEGIVQSPEAHALLSGEQIDIFMGRMLRSSISRRIIAEQHLALTEAFHNPDARRSIPGSEDSTRIGIIATRLDIATVIRRVIARVREELLAEGAVYPAPDVVLDGDLGTEMACVPEHVEWIVHQMVSNAMRSTMLRPPHQRDDVPIRMTVVEGRGDHDVLIRSSDSGGGLPMFVSPTQDEGNHVERSRRSSTHIIVPYLPQNEAEASDLAHRGGGAFHAPDAQRHAKQAIANSPIETASVERDQRDFAFGDDATPRMARSQSAMISSSSPRSVGSSGQEQDELVRLFCSFSLVKDRVDWMLAHKASESTADAHAAGLPGLAFQAHKTGLGLPVTKVYCDFFGGSLALRSLDGHSTDVYVRLPKLGRTRKDAVEEIVL